MRFEALMHPLRRHQQVTFAVDGRFPNRETITQPLPAEHSRYPP